jgi:O-antigen/teichoic acid export membrane protein
MDLIVKINAVGSIGQTVVLLTVLLLGGGLVGAVGVIAGGSIFLAAAFAWSSIKLLPSLSKPRIRQALVRPLWRFGGAVVVSSLAALVLANGEKVLLARYGSVRALAHYSVAFVLAMTLTQVPSAMGQSLLPALSRLQVGQDVAPLQQLSKRALHGTLFWVVPAALLMCVAARPFFTLWAGPEFGQESTLPFYILAFGLIFNVLAWVPYNLLIALGKTGLIARFHLVELIPYILLTVLLSSRFGAIGAAVAWSLRVALTSPLLIIFAQRAAGFSLSPWPRNPVTFAASVALLLAPPIIATFLWHLPFVSIVVTIASVAAYTAVIWTRILTDEERSGMRSLVRGRRFQERMESGGTVN